LALATTSFESIAEGAAQVFKQRGVEVDWKVLEVVGGSIVSK
jgi:homoserine kinase